MFAVIARFASRFKYLIFLGWVALAVIFFLAAPSLSQVGVTDQSQFLPDDTSSSHVRSLLETKFAGYAGDTGSDALIVIYNESGLTEQNFNDGRVLHSWMLSPNGPDFVTGTVSIYDNEALRSTLISQDNTTMLMTVNFSDGAIDRAPKKRLNKSAISSAFIPALFLPDWQCRFLQDLFNSVQAPSTGLPL